MVFSSTDNGFEQNAQYARRLSGYSVQKTDFELAIAMSPSRALQAANMALYSAVAGRLNVRFSTNLRQSALKPGHVVRLISGGLNLRVRITSRDDGMGVIRFEGVTDNKNAYKQTAVASGGAALVNNLDTGGVRGPALSLSTVYDLTLIDQADQVPSAYVSVFVSDGAWPGANIFVENAAGMLRAPVVVARKTVCGSATSVLAAPVGDIIEVDMTSFVSVELGRGQTLSSITRAQLLAGGNRAMLGDEILQFETAELIAEDTFKLSGMLRGRKGTALNTSGHLKFESFSMLSSMVRVPLLPTDVGVELFLKTVTSGAPMSEAAETSFVVTDGGWLGAPAPLQAVRVFYGADFVTNNGETTGGDVVLSGMGEPGDTVNVFNNGSASAMASAMVDANSAWAIPASLTIAAYSLTYRVDRVVAGVLKTTASSPAKPFSVSWAPPATPTAIATGTAGGVAILSGSTTPERRVTLSGNGVAADYALIFKASAPTAEVGRSLLNGSGAWSWVQAADLVDGAHSYIYKYERTFNAQVKISGASPAFEFTVGQVIPIGSAETYRYLRVYITEPYAASYTAIDEIEFFNASGAAMPLPGVVMSSSGEPLGATYGAACTRGAGTWFGNGPYSNPWLQVDFGSATSVNTISLKWAPNPSHGSYQPTALTIRGSNDGAVWDDLASIANEPIAAGGLRYIAF